MDNAQINDNNREAQELPVKSGIEKGADGVLRWVYEMNMWKNPTLVITIWKVLLLAALIPALLVFLLSIGEGFSSALILFVRILGITAGSVTVLLLLAYPLIALLNGGKYCVVFELDDNGIRHIQMQKQYERNRVFAMLVALSGLASGEVQVAGAGLLAGSKRSSTSSFRNVRSIKVNEKRRVIYLNENFSYNQVYADTENFPFVSEFIISHCKKAKVTYK
jgi:hypothetical protein